LDRIHQKHGKTVKANFGKFGRLELGILGTPCGEIKKMSKAIIQQLKGFNLAYVDADHKSDGEPKSDFLEAGSQVVYTDKIEFQQFEYAKSFDRYQRNAVFNECDLVLINGNHFEAHAQIVVVDERKPLKGKLDRITRPIMILLQDDQGDLPEYLKDHIEDLDIIPVLRVSDIQRITQLLQDLLILNTPKLYGLVLAGGKSERMGRDKGLLEYHGMPQRDYVYHQLSRMTDKTYMSCRSDQIHELGGQFELIPDSLLGLGPFGAILSAFREHPNSAWLVAACDLPLLTDESLKTLIAGRNPGKIATAFHNPSTDFPEPLIAIYEPKAYPKMLHFLGLGYSCPRKVLINSSVETLNAPDPKQLKNINLPEEMEDIMRSMPAENK